ncbi:hypothetical protein D3C72_2205960 [compost metagenome]
MRADVELAVDVLAMRLDGVLRHPEALGQGAGRMATQDQLGDAAFALGQDRRTEVVQCRVDALLQLVFKSSAARVQADKMLAQQGQDPGRNALELLRRSRVELFRERQ